LALDCSTSFQKPTGSAGENFLTQFSSRLDENFLSGSKPLCWASYSGSTRRELVIVCVIFVFSNWLLVVFTGQS